MENEKIYWFNRNYTVAPESLEQIYTLWPGLIGLRDNLRDQDRPKLDATVIAWITNLAMADEMGLPMRISLAKDNWKQGAIYANISLDLIKKLMDLFEKTGQIEVQKGFWDREKGQKFRTKITPLLAFSKNRKTIKIRRQDAPERGEALVLEAKSRVLSGFCENFCDLRTGLSYVQDSNKLPILIDRASTEKLAQINAELAKATWTWTWAYRTERGEVLTTVARQDPPAYHHPQIKGPGRQILGGRIYAHMSNTPKELRPQTRCNDKPLVELDLKAHHIQLLYALDGLQLPDGDLYSDNQTDRPYMKLLCLIMLNAKNRFAAAGALQKKCLETGLAVPSRDDCFSLMDDMEARHSGIAEHFYSGIGVKLMGIEGEICIEVASRFVQAGKIPPVSIHDSFAVIEEELEFLINTILDVYKERFGCFPRFEIKK